MKEIFSDAPAQEDLLGRKGFAQDIAYTLLHSLPNNSESIVLGLNGRWGSGKSTLLNLIIKALKDENKDEEQIIIYNDFNPWMFSGQDALQKEFLTGLKEKLEKNSKLKKHFKWVVEKAKKGLDFIPDKIDLDIISTDLELNVPYKAEFGKVLDALISVRSVDKLKKIVDDLIQKENIRLFIFIDDLDRLAPEEIIQIFQLVKLNANFKNTVFIIAYDAEIVQMALEKHYGENGKRYLGKIVQVDYTIPEMTIDEIGNEFFKYLRKFVIDHSINYDPNNLIAIWENQKFKNYFSTLRDVYRYFNALLFRLPKIKDEINVEHFLILEAIRIFDFPSYQNIYMICKENLSNYGMINPIKGSNEENYKNSTSLHLITRLFASSLSNMPIFTGNSRKEISDRMYFENYFSLKVTGSNITEKEFQDFMKIPQKRNGILDSVIKHGGLEAFLRRLTNSDISQEYQINETHIFLTLLDAFKDNNQLLEEYSYQLFYALINLAYNYKNRSEGYEKLIDIICSDTSTLHPSKYWILHWFYLDIREPHNIPSSQSEYKKVLLRNKEKIVEFLDRLFKNWNSFPFYHNDTNINRYIKKQFIQDIARLCPDDYSKQLDEVFKHINMNFRVLLLILETFLVFDSRDNKPVRIDGKIRRLLIPNEAYLAQFVNMLEKIESEYSDILDKNSKANISYFFEESSHNEQ